MSDEMRDFLHRGARAPKPTWGFETLSRRSQRRRIYEKTVRGVAALAVVTVGAVTITSIDIGSLLDRHNDAAPVTRNGGPYAGSTDPDRDPDLSDATWQRMPAAPIGGRYDNVAVWTGEEMLVWGGRVGDSSTSADGAAFDPLNDEWRRLSDSPLTDAMRAAVWTGQEMLLWGGEKRDHEKPDDGAAYDPRTDTWRELPQSPYWSLANHSAVWTGEEMIVWGGVSPVGFHGAGAALDPRAGAWRTIAEAPIEGRWGHSAVWTGTEMIVWGGGPGGDPHSDGAAYDPASDSWRELPPAPISGRDLHAAVWTGQEMIVWGGWSGRDVTLSDGAAYDPASNSWRELPRAPISPPPLETAAVWTGREMIVIGEAGNLAVYSVGENDWERVPQPPSGSVDDPTLVGTDHGVILWRGVPRHGDGFSNDGAILHLGE